MSSCIESNLFQAIRQYFLPNLNHFHHDICIIYTIYIIIFPLYCMYIYINIYVIYYISYFRTVNAAVDQ